VAVKVAKDEKYVRQRLFLTNLTKAVAKAYRAGELPDSFAPVIAKLAPAAQDETLKAIKDSYGDFSLADLNRHIERHYANPLRFQPWLKDAAIAKIVGPCKECPPIREALFGSIKTGQCTDLRCWERKMAVFIAHKQETEPALAFVSSFYGKSDVPWAISRSEYQLLESKKDRCEFARNGLVIHGDDIGKSVLVCTDGSCKKHHEEHRPYAPTKEERAKRKKELVKQRAKDAKRYGEFVSVIKHKVSWPLSEKALAVLIEKALDHHGLTSLMDVARRLELKTVKEKTDWGGDRNSYKPPLRAWIAKASKEDRLRLYFELTIDRENAKNL